MSRKVLAIGVIGTIVVVVVAVLCVLGYVYGGLKHPGQTIKLSYAICDQAIVQRYNDALWLGDRAEVLVGLKPIVADIEGREQYTQDPTCEFMRIYYYLEKNDMKKVEQAYANLKHRVEQGDDPSAKIDNLASITTLQGKIESYATEPSQISPNEAPGGG